VGDSLVVAGPVTSAQGDSVTRPVLDVVGDAREPGSSAGVNRDVRTRPDQLGLEYTEVELAGPDATFPAWLIPGSSSTWAVLVHGKAGTARGSCGWPRRCTSAA